MIVFGFFIACGVHTPPQKKSIDTSLPESTVPTSVKTGVHNGIFTGYNPQAIVGEMKENCRSCRRGMSAIEKSFIDQCKQAGGEFIICGCFEMLCSVKIAPQ